VALPARFVELLRDVARRIVDAQRPVRILRALAWPDAVEHAFFAADARELPRPQYRVPRDWSQTLIAFADIRARVSGDNEIERLVRDTCDAWAAGARMLAAVGTRDFYQRSVECYGRPASLSEGGKTNLDLAQHFDRVLATYAGVDLGPEPRPVSADEVAGALGRRLRETFTDDPIRCEVADTLSANAVTSSEVVKVKRGAAFTERDIEQLLVHEGHVHLGTTLNGRRQPVLGFLAQGAPRTTRTQEGLAIFAEFITHAMDLDRLRRLTDRILAVRMSEEGADFRDLYWFFRERGHAEKAAFDCARRVVRGGLVEGGAPFTKDVVYLDGLLGVANFLRVAATRGHAGWVRLLFAGKVALADVPLLEVLERDGVVAAPRYVPPWARDLGFLTAYMSFSAFLQETDLGATFSHFEPRIEGAASLDQSEPRASSESSESRASSESSESPESPLPPSAASASRIRRA
jgi:uncharacterized protein (TIGR02421 family)